jgi:hypothetical protein
MDHILAHPELHRQDRYAVPTECGTAHCFAGFACVLSGLRVDEGDIRIHGSGLYLADGRSIPNVARDLLGVDRTTAFELFDPDNTTADLKHYVDQIAEHGRIVDPVTR